MQRIFSYSFKYKKQIDNKKKEEKPTAIENEIKVVIMCIKNANLIKITIVIF